MAKRKKQRKQKQTSQRQPPRLMRDLTDAMALFKDGDAAAARRQLLPLITKRPRSKPVLLALLEVCTELQDWQTFALYSERLIAMERGADQAESLNNLIFAHIQMAYPALAWFYAHELVTKHPNFGELEQVRELIDVTEPILLGEADKMADTVVLSTAEKIDLMVQYDRVRFYTESGHSDTAIPIAESLLEQFPHVISVLNNLSLSQFMVGAIEQAIATAHKVLDLEPDNFHALGNMTRFTFLTGLFEQARQYVDRLQQITDDAPDLAAKQIEALAFLGDDKGIQTIYERVKTQEESLSPLLLHLAATAHYRLGDQKMAWNLWKKAVKIAPSFEMAANCLGEQNLPVGERDVPWYWPFQYWASGEFHQALGKVFGNAQRMSNKAVNRAMESLLGKRPYLIQLFPHMLERGDRVTREFVLNAVRIIQTPELLQILYDFALGQYGDDAIRMEAMQFISQNHPGMLPESKEVPLWINGQQTELFMMGFEITDEPDLVDDIAEEILDKHEAAVDLLRGGESDAAERLLHEIIAAAPDFYSAYNHLAAAYEQQGRKEEARALIEETHVRFPDYLFARVALARILTREKRIEEARGLLDPVIRQTRMHISEFRALARAQMDIALADNRSDAAKSWLEMWRQMEEDNPELMEWHMRIDGPGNLLQGLQKLMDRRRKKR